MKPNNMRKAYAELFLADRKVVQLSGDAEDARQDVVAVIGRFQTEMERTGGLAAEQGDAATMTAAQELLERAVWIRITVNRDLLAYLDTAADLGAARAMVEEANDRLAKVASGTARAIKRFEKAAPVLASIEKLVKFVKEH
jgi:hypothetical protein